MEKSQFIRRSLVDVSIKRLHTYKSSRFRFGRPDIPVFNWEKHLRAFFWTLFCFPLFFVLECERACVRAGLQFQKTVSDAITTRGSKFGLLLEVERCVMCSGDGWLIWMCVSYVKKVVFDAVMGCELKFWLWFEVERCVLSLVDG